MSKNIYDLFDERKNGIDMLVEGSEEVEEFETIEAGVEALELITQECANSIIELQAANYLEDLVLENMMFDHFDEEEMSEIIEGAMKERLAGWGARIKDAWNKIKAWFASIIKSIGTFFRANDEFVKQHKDEIADAIKQCSIKVKMNEYRSFKLGMNEVRNYVHKLKGAGFSNKLPKEAITAVVGGAKDRSQIPEVIKRCFVKSEGKQFYIYQIPPAMAIEYGAGGKDIIDFLRKEQKRVDDDFMAILKEIDRAGEGDENAKKFENFMYAIGLQNTIYNNAIVVVKKACSDMVMVCRKAVGKIGNAVADGKVIAQGYADVAKDNIKQKASDIKAGAKAMPGKVAGGVKSGAKAVANKLHRTKESYEWDEYDDTDDVYEEAYEYEYESFDIDEYDYLEEGLREMGENVVSKLRGKCGKWVAQTYKSPLRIEKHIEELTAEIEDAETILKEKESDGKIKKMARVGARLATYLLCPPLASIITSKATQITSNKDLKFVIRLSREELAIFKNRLAEINKLHGGEEEVPAEEAYDYYDEDEYGVVEEGLLNKFRKLSDEELSEKIDQLQAAVDDIDNGDGPKKFQKKAHKELKAAKSEQARRGKKSEKAEAKAAKKAEKAAKKAAKKGGGEMPAAEAFVADLDDIEFDDDDWQ